MSSHAVLLLLVCLLLLIGAWLYLRSKSSHSSFCSQESHRAHLPRLLKPRTPLDCPLCCLAAVSAAGKVPTQALVRPWREVKADGAPPNACPPKGWPAPTVPARTWASATHRSMPW